MDQLTFSLGEPLANPLASPGSERDWMTRVVTWPSNMRDFLDACGLAGSSGKTSPEHFRPGAVNRTQVWTITTKAGKRRWSKRTISHESLKRLLNAGMGSPGEFLTLKISECPSDAVASSLSDILETGDLPQRYFLSARACAGILRRAEKRGRKLPEHLEQALRTAADGE